MTCARLLRKLCVQTRFNCPSTLSNPACVHLLTQSVHVYLFAMAMQVGLASVYPSRHDAAAALVASECAGDGGSFAVDEAALQLALTRCVDVGGHYELGLNEQHTSAMKNKNDDRIKRCLCVSENDDATSVNRTQNDFSRQWCPSNAAQYRGKNSFLVPLQVWGLDSSSGNSCLSPCSTTHANVGGVYKVCSGVR